MKSSTFLDWTRFKLEKEIVQKLIQNEAKDLIEVL